MNKNHRFRKGGSHTEKLPHEIEAKDGKMKVLDMCYDCEAERIAVYKPSFVLDPHEEHASGKEARVYLDQNEELPEWVENVLEKAESTFNNVEIGAIVWDRQRYPDPSMEEDRATLSLATDESEYNITYKQVKMEVQE